MPIALPRAGAAGEHARALLADCGLETATSGPGSCPPAALDWATSGAMSLCGHPDEPPRFAPGPLATAARGAGLALAALAPGTPLARLDAPGLLGERAALFGLSRRGRISAGGSARMLPTRDGWLVANLPRDEDWSLVPAWLERPTATLGARDWETISRVLRSAEGSAVVARGRMMGLAIAEAPRRIEPSRSWLSPSHLSTRAHVPRRHPVRLLDLSNLWAGPLAASLLGMAGIEVLKVESPVRPDGARRGPRPFFDLLNGGKLGCALDLHDRRDRTRFERLLEAADIVLESSRPRGLEQLGFDAGGWVSARPGRIWASITGYGRTGAERDWIAFGDDAAIAAGLGWSDGQLPEETGGREPTPCFCADAIADPLTGLHAAIGILGHWRAGRGGLLDFSLVEVARRAAGTACETLTLPLERGPRGWSVVTEGRAVPVERPRARPVTAEAPPLASPGDGLWESGSPPC